MAAGKKYVSKDYVDDKLGHLKEIIKLQNLVFFLLGVVGSIGLGMLLAFLLN